MIILDTECYSDYFLIMCKEIESGIITHSEVFPGNPINAVGIKTVMENYTTISFNGISYDLPLIKAALEGFDNKYLKKLSDKIIKSNRPSWSICKDNNIIVPDEWDHVDLIEVSPGFASLKVYGGRMNMPKMQDLPIAPDEKISPETREIIRKYCINDLDTTEALYKTLLPQIRLRESMSEQYGIDLRSKSDAQIAEAVIKSELHKTTKRTYKQPKIKDGHTIQYQDPQIVKFDNPELSRIFLKLLDHDFEFAPNGAIKLPKGLKETKIKIGNSEYNMGIGGLHSCEKSQLIRNDDRILCELDVRGYYPSIILQQRLSPKTMGVQFLKIYQDMVEKRNNAKLKMQEIEKEIADRKRLFLMTKNEIENKIKELEKEYVYYKTEADVGKLACNGSFGKLGSKYSALYAPELFLQVTLTGQLCLLMLIERMENMGIVIVSVNTDGIVCHANKQQEHDMETVAWDWMLDTSFNLERTDYELLASRDVNSYFAVKSDGKVKRKGIFNIGGLMKNPNRNIVYTAVIAFLKDDVPIEDTIRACNDPSQFVTVRKVQGGARFDGELLGKSVRFYSSTETFFIDPYIHYVLNDNKVPKSSGCRPLMDMGEELPTDLDYEAYINDAEKLLGEVGYA